jgi:hypothetical protein
MPNDDRKRILKLELQIDAARIIIEHLLANDLDAATTAALRYVATYYPDAEVPK